ncbi:MAG: 5-(carboxyamino)imidazole ribonucleotide mutase [Deltaproteobacteria bacterium]|nr:5-(carboxyamino)imidazole ribonucleotide mutase [Deltaproteobacteria bacterium]
MKVAIFLGSKNDLEFAKEAERVFKEFRVEYESIICSAHRSAEKLVAEIKRVEKREAQVLIGMAGYAAHLPGTLASRSYLPVLGVPLPTSDLGGIDSLLSIAQMPAGVPVATFGLGKPGAKNAALFAIQILSSKDISLKKQWEKYRKKLSG